MNFDNKNAKQIYFNHIKGVISELNDAPEYCSVTISCGHENIKQVNLGAKKEQFDKLKLLYKIGDRVNCGFHIASNKKGERWYTSAILLSINLE